MILSLLRFLKWQLKGQPFSSSYFILALPGPPGSPRHVSYLQLLIARARHTAFNVHMKIWESHSCLYQQFCLCAMFRARLIFQVGDVRLSFLPVYIMFVILIYRVKKSCIYSQVGIAAVAVNENWSLVLPPPAGLVGLILIFLQSCNMPANEPQNRSRTTWGLETVGPILAVAHHQLHLLLLYITLCYSQQHSLKSVMGRSKCQSHNCHYFPTCNY